MLSVTLDPRGFGRVAINGRITAEQMRDGLDAFLAMLPDDGKMSFLYDIQNFAFPEYDAFAEKMRDIPTLFQALGRIDKIAMVADPGWLRAVAEFEGMLIPGLTIKSFSPEEITDAEAWVSLDD